LFDLALDQHTSRLSFSPSPSVQQQIQAHGDAADPFFPRCLPSAPITNRHHSQSHPTIKYVTSLHKTSRKFGKFRLWAKAWWRHFINYYVNMDYNFSIFIILKKHKSFAKRWFWPKVMILMHFCHKHASSYWSRNSVWIQIKW